MSGSIIYHALNSSVKTVRITITSWCARWRLKSPASRLFTQELFRRTSKKTSKLLFTGLCEGNSPVTSEFPAQMASNAENYSIWWRHHDAIITKYRDDCPRSERPRTSNARPFMGSLRPEKASDILLMECSNAFHSTKILYFDKV